MFTRSSSAETDDPCLSSEAVSSLPRVGLRLCPGVVSTDSLTLSIAISKTVPCRVLRGGCVACKIQIQYCLKIFKLQQMMCHKTESANHNSTKLFFHKKKKLPVVYQIIRVLQTTNTVVSLERKHIKIISEHFCI